MFDRHPTTAPVADSEALTWIADRNRIHEPREEKQAVLFEYVHAEDRPASRWIQRDHRPTGTVKIGAF